jgi:sensor c-di-GMP phosphodiesterase-like protein
MDRRYMAPELLESEKRRQLDEEERRSATIWLPIGIAAGLMAAIVWVFLMIAPPSGQMQTSQLGSAEHSVASQN